MRWEDLAVEARVLVGQRARPTVLSFYCDALLARSPWLHVLAPAQHQACNVVCYPQVTRSSDFYALRNP